jgi:hypothetical protein
MMHNGHCQSSQSFSSRVDLSAVVIQNEGQRKRAGWRVSPFFG